METPTRFHHTSQYLVYYEDTDFTGYVFHPNFLKYFDRAREDIFGTKMLKDLFDAGTHFVVRKVKVDYLKPASHGQMLVVKTTGVYSRSPLLVFEHRVEVGNEVICQGEVELIAVNQRGFPVRLPEAVLQQLSSLCS